MSNFKCEKCGANILEDKNGHYFTGCDHYPLEFRICKVCNGLTMHNTNGDCLKCKRRKKSK